MVTLDNLTQVTTYLVSWVKLTIDDWLDLVSNI